MKATQACAKSMSTARRLLRETMRGLDPSQYVAAVSEERKGRVRVAIVDDETARVSVDSATLAWLNSPHRSGLIVLWTTPNRAGAYAIPLTEIRGKNG